MSEHEIFQYTIEKKQEELTTLLKEWVSINSGSYNLKGLDKMREALKSQLASIGPVKEISLPPEQRLSIDGKTEKIPLGKALLLTLRPEADTQILLAGHMDTVFPENHPFQTSKQEDITTLIGPGAADMKGGLLVMLEALKLFEASPYKNELGFRVCINPDEEIGSTGSYPFIRQTAQGCSYALVFEPSLPDGTLVSTRKGSANYTLVIKGKGAHAGRDFYRGVHAIFPLGPILCGLEDLNKKEKDAVTVNIASLQAPGPVNNVPDTLYCRINIRAKTNEDFEKAEKKLYQLIENEKKPGLTLYLNRDSFRFPKVVDEGTKRLMKIVEEASQDLGIGISWKETGGVCDGNVIAEEGVPCIDTLGVIGGKMHTCEEFIFLPSLVERAKLTYLILEKIALEKRRSS